jgi:hypothetical protein
MKEIEKDIDKDTTVKPEDIQTCKSCGVILTQEDLDYDGGRKGFCKDCN